MEITQIPNYADRCLPFLLEQYRDSAKLRGILAAFLAEMDKLEAAMFEVRVLLRISTAEGEQLDLIGRIMNQPRQGRPDDEYRQALAIWFRTRASGTPENIIKTIQELTGALQVEYFTEYPAGFFLYTPGAVEITNELIELFAPAGVQAMSACMLADTTGDPILAVDDGDWIAVIGPCGAVPITDEAGIFELITENGLTIYTEI